MQFKRFSIANICRRKSLCKFLIFYFPANMEDWEFFAVRLFFFRRKRYNPHFPRLRV